MEQTVLREGIRLLVESESDLCIAPDGEGLDADVILLDLGDPGALQILKEGSSGPSNRRFIVLSDEGELNELDIVLKAGARGVVVKTAHPASLLQAIRSVSQGRKWLDPEIQERLMSPEAIHPSPSRRWQTLSKREREVAKLVLQGQRYKDIAVKLHISDHTVRNHLRNIFTKLQITSRVELAPYAHEVLPG